MGTEEQIEEKRERRGQNNKSKRNVKKRINAELQPRTTMNAHNRPSATSTLRTRPKGTQRTRRDTPRFQRTRAQRRIAAAAFAASPRRHLRATPPVPLPPTRTLLPPTVSLSLVSTPARAPEKRFARTSPRALIVAEYPRERWAAGAKCGANAARDAAEVRAAARPRGRRAGQAAGAAAAAGRELSADCMTAGVRLESKEETADRRRPEAETPPPRRLAAPDVPSHSDSARARRPSPADRGAPTTTVRSSNALALVRSVGTFTHSPKHSFVSAAAL